MNHHQTQEPRLSLPVALRLYWKYYWGLVLFPPIAIPAITIFQVPFPFIAVPFFAVSFLAGWPWLAKRAPYSFWLVAMAVWMASGVFGILATLLLSTIFHIPLT